VNVQLIIRLVQVIIVWVPIVQAGIRNVLLLIVLLFIARYFIALPIIIRVLPDIVPLVFLLVERFIALAVMNLVHMLIVSMHIVLGAIAW
jgi:hypothetical protein